MLLRQYSPVIYRVLVFFCVAVFVCTAALAQHGRDTTLAQHGRDTALAGKDTGRNGQAHRDTIHTPSGRQIIFKTSDTSVGHLIQKIEIFTLTLNQFNSVLKRGFDTTVISDQLPALEEDVLIAKENIGSYGQRANLRNLNVTRILLFEIQRKLKVWQGQLFAYSNQLSSMNSDIQEMRSDSALRNLPDDSTLKSLYFQQIRDLIRKWRKADSVNRMGLINIGSLQSRVAMRYLEVTDLYDDVNYRIRHFGKEMFQRDDEWLWKATRQRYASSFGEVVSHSFVRGKSILGFYLASSSGTSLLILIVSFIFFLWVRRNLNKIKKEKNAEEIFSRAEFLARFPVMSSVVFGLLLGNFLYQYPPAAYTTMLGILLFVLITDLLWLKWPEALHRFWIGIGILYLLNSFLNLLVENSLVERFALLVLASVAIVLATAVLSNIHASFMRYQKIARVMIILFNIMNALSLLANISGHYALAKLLCTSAIFNLFLAIGLLFMVEIVLDALYLQSESYGRLNRLSYHFNFKEVKGRIRNGLLMGAGILWFVGFSKGLSFYDYFYEGISNFLSEERKIGNSSFSFGSVAIFGIVIWVSSLISQLISYLFGNKGQTVAVKKTNLGSYMLLARIGILALGILLAFSASGIPMDKLAIVIGALGVGIGFGLQNIVNNLVSGIILAFEKPVQIGDLIDVGAHSGTVKEIGFRSSKITTADGAEVIIPNGDLISQQVTNWTMSNNFRRVELIIGVAYGTDLNICRECISKAVKEKDTILPFPEPIILVHQLADSAVNFRILFWATDIATWISIKSQVLQDIYDNLKLAGIDIPFPQRELHIASVDADLINALKNGSPDKNEGSA